MFYYIKVINVFHFSDVPKMNLPADHPALDEVRGKFVQFSVDEIEELRKDGNGVFVDYDEIM